MVALASDITRPPGISPVGGQLRLGSGSTLTGQRSSLGTSTASCSIYYYRKVACLCAGFATAVSCVSNFSNANKNVGVCVRAVIGPREPSEQLLEGSARYLRARGGGNIQVYLSIGKSTNRCDRHRLFAHSVSSCARTDIRTPL